MSNDNLNQNINEFFKSIEDQSSSEVLKAERLDNENNTIISKLIKGLNSRDVQQQYASAKAMGYLGKSNALNARQVADLRSALVDKIGTSTLTTGAAFTILEALERVDHDEFWTLIIGWYNEIVKEKPESPPDIESVLSVNPKAVSSVQKK